MKKIKKTIPWLVKRILFLVLFFAIGAGIIMYARGYRFDPEKKSLTSHGIISISASPTGSKVYVDGVLKGVTDLNLTLPNGVYKIQVKKDGYTTWSRTVRLKGELVVTLDVLLYPLNPSLSPITNLGIKKAVGIENTGKVIIFAQNDDPEKDGIYLYEPSNSPINLFAPLKLLVSSTLLPAETDLSNSTLTFSPDLKQAILDINKDGEINTSYLIALDSENDQLFDVTTSKDALLEAWEEQKQDQIRKIVEVFPKDLHKVASDSMHIVAFSPDESKVLYQAKNQAELPPVITPPLISPNQTPETRIITPLYLYVYDKKEDRNYLVQSDPDWIRRFHNGYVLADRLSLQNEVPEETFIYWHPDSKHLLFNEPNKIVAIGYDGQDKQTVYSGPFNQGFFSVASQGNPVIMTNFNPQNNPNPDLYVVGIK